MRSRGKAVISHVIKQLSELDFKEHITPSLVIAQPENAQHRRGSAVPDGEERPLAPGPSSPSPCRSVALTTEISVIWESLILAHMLQEGWPNSVP